MKVRLKKTGDIGQSDRFNNSSPVSEVIVYYEEGDADSVFIKDLDVLLSNGKWKDMSMAFNDKDLIPDNYNVRFKEPSNYEERNRGYY